MPAGARADVLYAAQAPGAAVPEYADPGFGVAAQVGSVAAGAGIGVRDGTPARIAGVLILSGATIAVLRLLGFRFNVGYSG